MLSKRFPFLPLLLILIVSASAWSADERKATQRTTRDLRQTADEKSSRDATATNDTQLSVDKPLSRTSKDAAHRRSPRWRDSVIQLHAGTDVSFLVSGNGSINLQQARAIRYQRVGTRAVAEPTRSLRPRIGVSTRQGTWISVAAASNAHHGLYWVEGITADRVATPMPILLEVVPASTRVSRFAPAPSSRILPAETRIKALSPVAKRQPQGSQRSRPVSRDTLMATRHTQPLIATRQIGGERLRYDPRCELTGAQMLSVLDAGAPLPCRGNVSVRGPSQTTYLLSHSPEDMGTVGGTLTVIAENLTNPGNVRVRIGGQSLGIQSATPSRLVATLPSTPGVGSLVVERTDGEILGVLNQAYQVVPPPSQTPALFSDFTGEQNTVSWKLGYQLAMLSWLAYFDGLGTYLQNNPAFASQLGVSVRRTFDETRYGFDVCHFASGSMQGAVFEHAASNSVIVAVRGSQTGDAYQDWWDNDLDGQPFSRLGWALGNGLHCGFHQAARVVFDELVSELKNDDDAGRKIWVTGHSLGGAAAMLLAAMLEWDAQIDVDGVYTYGAPGVGNAIFINAYQQDIPNTHRFEIQQDPAVSLFYPLYGRPGRNHLLHADGGFDLNANQGYLAYLGHTPISDLGGAHMEYWCRGFAEMDEATPEDLLTMLPLPPSQPDPSSPPVCDATAFYGNLQ